MNDALERLGGTVDATRRLLELILDNERNRIERMELYLSMAGLGLGAVSAVGGVFGMNLVSGWEDHPRKFWGVTYATLAAAGAGLFAVWQQFHLGRELQREEVRGGLGALRRALVPQLPPAF